MPVGCPGRQTLGQNSGGMKFPGGAGGAPVTEAQMRAKQEWVGRVPVGTDRPVGAAPLVGRSGAERAFRGSSAGGDAQAPLGPPRFRAVLSHWLPVSGRTGRA